MSVLNTEEWTPTEVANWMAGLHSNICVYASTFLQKGVSGHLLLNLMAGDLQKFGVVKIGDQLMLQEAILALRADLDTPRTTLQSLSSNLSIRCRNYRSELSNLKTKKNYIPTENLSSASYLLDSAKTLIRWLTRFPFLGNYDDITLKLIKHCFELAMLSQRDSFADNAIEEVQYLCTKMIEICEGIVGSRDSLVIQPALVDVVTLKKSFGAGRYSNNNFVEPLVLDSNIVCTKTTLTNLERGDEILQVNRTTVIAWPTEKIQNLLTLNKNKEILLTVKRRPRHASANILSHMHLKPAINKIHQKSTAFSEEESKKISPVVEEDIKEIFVNKPRNLIKRRATVTGASPTETRPPVTFDQSRPPLINSKSAPDKILIKQSNVEIVYSSVLHLREIVTRPRWVRVDAVYYNTGVLKFGKLLEVNKSQCKFSIASEVHSRPFAFKIEQTDCDKIHYLAAESMAEFNNWISILIGESAIIQRAPYKRSISLGSSHNSPSTSFRSSPSNRPRISRQFSRSSSISSKSAWLSQSTSRLETNNISSITISSSVKKPEVVIVKKCTCSAENKIVMQDACTQTEELLLILNQENESCV